MLHDAYHFSLSYCIIVEQLLYVCREIPDVQLSRHEVLQKKGKRELCFHLLEIHEACDMEEIVIAIYRSDDFAVCRMAFFRKCSKPLQPIN